MAFAKVRVAPFAVVVNNGNPGRPNDLNYTIIKLQYYKENQLCLKTHHAGTKSCCLCKSGSDEPELSPIPLRGCTEFKGGWMQ